MGFICLLWQYSDSEDDSGDEPPPKAQVTSKGSTRCLTRGKYLDNIPLKRRLYSLCKCLIDYVVRLFHSTTVIAFVVNLRLINKLQYM